MALPKIPLDDPRVLALAKARQQFAHDCAFLPTWEELPEDERKVSLPSARNYLESAINAGLVPAVELIDSGWRASLTNINDEIERQTTAMATAAADLPLLLYRFPLGRASALTHRALGQGWFLPGPMYRRHPPHSLVRDISHSRSTKRVFQTPASQLQGSDAAAIPWHHPIEGKWTLGIKRKAA
ncbi:hypothetical protein ACIBHY_36245 [Nonomuraea sp. NPDC050547]|uniref:hypothetical protein n=1 Tax=unclassified Nonomuraea TaxID=2593643 RepID=UPI0037B24C52